jgi:hypothetical protein
MKRTFHGSCHCKAIAFEANIDLSAGSTRCNCSFCTKARFWMALVKSEDFRLIQGRERLTNYQHTPPARPEPFLHLSFCSCCGVRPFSRGGFLPALGSAFYAVNLGALDDATDEELSSTPIKYVDGRHDDWSATPAAHGYL